jgi:hypothetical protein
LRDAVLGDHHAHRSVIEEHDFADACVELLSPERMSAAVVAMDAEFGLNCDFDFGDQRAGAGIPAGEVDARGFPDDAASAVAADEVLPAQGGVWQLHVAPASSCMKPAASRSR